VTSQCRPTLGFHVEVGATREPRREQQRLGTVGSEQRHGAAAGQEPAGDSIWT
jgi:hypothetical protein